MNVLKLALNKLWQGAELTGDDRIALVLLITMMASTAHLLTMVATKWGDRNVAMKSFLASVMVHSVCLMSLEVFEPIVISSARAMDDSPAPEEMITQILIESDDSVAVRESGNTPIPDQPTEPIVELERTLQANRLMEVPDAPEPDLEVLDSIQPEVEDVSQFQQSVQPEVAIRVDAGVEGPRMAAASDPAADIQTMLEQSKADVYTPSKERVQTERGDILEQDNPIERLMNQGSVDQIDTEIVTQDTSIATATNDLPDAIALPSAIDSESVSRRSAPLNSSDPLETVGVSTDQPERRTMPARSFESRLPRPSRTMRSPDPGDRPVRQNSSIARTPIPLSTDYDEVRIGSSSMNLTDALRSAATMVDSDALRIRRRESRAATYQLRSVKERREAAARFGGTRESEAAVEMSLKWLTSMQSPDGHWDAETHGAGQVKVDENQVNRDYSGRDADTGITALVTLSLLGAGYTHEQGKYAINVDDALAWLISQQDSEGSLAGEARHFARMYCHAMATYALAEALGMQENAITAPLIDPESLAVSDSLAQGICCCIMKQSGLLPFVPVAVTNIVSYAAGERNGYALRNVDDLRLRSALLKAVTYTISQQDPESGGWRYKFGQEGDISMFGWQMMSLKSAAIAGVDINPLILKRMDGFLNSMRQGRHGGLFSYRRSVVQPDGRQSEPVTPVMTAEALFCQQMLGYKRDTATSREAVQYLLQNTPRLSKLDMYYWYYGTLAMYQYGGEPWERWNRIVRDTLTKEQRTDGRFAGSWDPKGPWGRYGGRLYSTALSTMTLEVYYRLLPLYRMNAVPGDDAEN